MSNSKVDEYLQQGIHGAKEIKPDERKRFLTTLRERVIVALTQQQVMEKEVYPEVETTIKENPNAHLFLNGNLDYSYLSKYSTVAKKLKMEFTIVTNNEYNSDLGLVIASGEAIDKEDIFITKHETTPTEKEESGLLSVFQNIFKK